MNNIKRLSELCEGQSARVTVLNAQDAMRRRLMDIGLTTGARAKCVIQGKGISAYRIRGAITAIRAEDADTVTVCVCDEETPQY